MFRRTLRDNTPMNLWLICCTLLYVYSYFVFYFSTVCFLSVCIVFASVFKQLVLITIFTPVHIAYYVQLVRLELLVTWSRLCGAEDLIQKS